MFDVFSIRSNLLLLVSFLVVAFSRGARGFSQVTREVIAGDPHIDLGCPLNPLRNESATYRWLHKGEVLAACSYCSNWTVNITKFVTHPDWHFSLGKDFHFRISKPRIEDAGVYVCTDNSRLEVIQVTVKVLVPASTPVITSEPKLTYEKLYVLEGKDVIVSCSSDGKPAPEVSLQWRNVTMESFHSNVTRDYGEIYQEDRTTTKMYFVASRRQNGWKIQCLAFRNKTDALQAYIHIYVQHLSNLTALVVPSQAKPGERVVLLCQTEATLLTDLTWTKVGSTWTKNATKPIILENVSTKDAGTYVCNSRNRAGTQSKKASLLVKISPSKDLADAGLGGSSMLQAVLIFTVLIFLFLVAILAGIVHFICHSAAYNSSGPNKRRLPTLPAAYPSCVNPQRTTIDERSNSQISMKPFNTSSSIASSSPKTLIPPRPQAKLPQLPFKSQVSDTEHSYMNTAATQPDYLEVVDEKNDKEDLLYEDPDKNCFHSISRNDTPSSTLSSANTPQILLNWN